MLFKSSRFKHRLKLFVYKSTSIVLCFGWNLFRFMFITCVISKLLVYKIVKLRLILPLLIKKQIKIGHELTSVQKMCGCIAMVLLSICRQIVSMIEGTTTLRSIYYIIENSTNIETSWATFLKKKIPKLLKLIVRVSIYHIFIYI